MSFPSRATFPTDRMTSLVKALPPGSLVVCLTEPGVVKIFHAPQVSNASSVRAEFGFIPIGDAGAELVLVSDSKGFLPFPLLKEVSRILKRHGVVAGLVRDPAYEPDTQEEPLNGFPPSHWAAALAELGFQAKMVFDTSPSHLEFQACREAAALQSLPPAGTANIITDGDGLEACPRQGWAGQPGALRMTGLNAAIYLLNRKSGPLQVRSRLRVGHSSDFSTLRVRIDSFVLADLYLSSETLDHEIELPEFLLPAGGHHLFFDLFPGGPQVEVGQALFEARPTERGSLTEGLPFDLFQRYRLAALIAERLPVRTVLDVGGYLGDRYGHLAFSGDFFPRDFEVTSTDLRACDHPRHRQADACSQPFPEGSFDMVLCMDVLEHIPAGLREAMLEELLRVSSQYVVLAAPFDSPEVTEAERQLTENLLSARPFLQEHKELGLPQAPWLEQFFAGRGCAVYQLPNGFLPRWTAAQVMANHYGQGGDYLLSRTFNRLYNRSFFPFDQAAPAYRTVFLIGKRPFSRQHVERMDELLSASPAAPPERISDSPQFFEIHSRLAAETERRAKALSDVQFLANARQDYIALLRRELDEAPLARLIWRRLSNRGKKK
jgi:hypothetical protein